MSSDKPIVYDPDPTDLQMRAWDNISIDDLQPADLSTPQIVQLLIHNQRVTLAQLKATQGDVVRLRSENERLRNEREALRIQTATLASRVNTTWLEIPISVMSGFAINLLASDIKSGFGWFLLLISLLMLFYLRGSQLLNFIGRGRMTREEQGNAKD